jgi:hypothetical protein
MFRRRHNPCGRIVAEYASGNSKKLIWPSFHNFGVAVRPFAIQAFASVSSAKRSPSGGPAEQNEKQSEEACRATTENVKSRVVSESAGERVADLVSR